MYKQHNMYENGIPKIIDPLPWDLSSKVTNSVCINRSDD